MDFLCYLWLIIWNAFLLITFGIIRFFLRLANFSWKKAGRILIYILLLLFGGVYGYHVAFNARIQEYRQQIWHEYWDNYPCHCPEN